ncbi:glycosyltransferase [Novosphingobium sp. RD2P27]|uniref:Glycosyltransferase n=1 Tax=Novosphingobium kalidii TaxID=3230299 RepID=A0ABV2D015_9SPHN
MLIVVGIKALNEEDHIARTIESALAALDPFTGKVVLADSGSVDRTVEIARRYPIEIVQLANTDERCCGAGAQLAYQSAMDADFFYLLDGDMVLDAEFLKVAVARLQADPQVAGISGVVVECNLVSQQYRISQQNTKHEEANVDRLDGGGLYRVAAVASVNYFADRNLHAFEEFELGARLTSKGWRLLRIGQPAVYHYGHLTGGYRLLWRRLRSGYSGGAGEVLRAALGQPHFKAVLLRLRHLHVGAVVIVWWMMLAGAAASAAWPLLAVIIAAPWAGLALRRGSAALGLYSLASWNVATLGLIGGLLQRRTPPTEPLSHKRLKSLATGTQTQTGIR